MRIKSMNTKSMNSMILYDTNIPSTKPVRNKDMLNAPQKNLRMVKE